MNHQTLTQPIEKTYIPISFEFSAGQSTNTCSIGSWRPVSMNALVPDTFFRVPIDKRYELIDIRQNIKLDPNLIFSYVKNGIPDYKYKFDVNSAYVRNNPLKKTPQPIILNPNETIEFVAYPASSPNQVITEIVNAVFRISPVQRQTLVNRPNPHDTRYLGCSQTKTSQVKKPYLQCFDFHY